MSKDFIPSAHVAHMEKVLDLTIEEDWRSAVEGHMAAIQKAAELVRETSLEADTEAAPVFVA